MKQPVAGMLAKCRDAQREARILLEADHPEGSINRAYYASFYVASAALWLAEERPKTHAGVSDRFWVRFVADGDFPARHGRTLRRALEARSRADYDFVGRLDSMAAADLLGDVDAFMAATEVLVREMAEAED